MGSNSVLSHTHIVYTLLVPYSICITNRLSLEREWNNLTSKLPGIVD